MSGISLTNQGGGITPVNPDIEFIQGNDGVPVPPNPTTHIILLLGDNTQGVDLSGNAGAYTETITMFDSTELQKGVVLLADNAETLTGTETTKATTPEDVQVKVGVQTANGLAYGDGPGTAIQYLAEATDGQIPIGQTGAPPALANITSLDGSVTVTNGPGTIDLSVSNQTAGTGQTIGAVTDDLITIPLGATPGNYSFVVTVSAFEDSTPAGAQYFIVGSVRTDGASATLVGLPDPTINEDPALTAANCDIVVSGNNAIIRAFGVALLTINWSATVTILFRS